MTIETQGGADWELGEAARKLTDALAGGEGAAIEAAMRDHAAAVGSKSTQMIAALFTPLMQSVQDARSDIAAVAQEQVEVRLALGEAEQRQRQDESQNQFRASQLYQQIGAFLKETDERLDIAYGKFSEAVDRLGGLESRIERVEIGQAKLEVRVEAVETQGAPADAVSELHQVNKRVGRLELWVTLLTIAITANAIIYILAISLGGGR